MVKIVQDLHQTSIEVLEKIYPKLIDYILARPRSVREIKQKINTLATKYSTELLSKEALESLLVDYVTEQGYLNDSAYAKEVASALINSSKPRSNREISLFLQKKGVDISTISKALADFDTDLEIQNAKSFLAKNTRKISDKVSAKTLLYKKGYSLATIEAVLHED